MLYAACTSVSSISNNAVSTADVPVSTADAVSAGDSSTVTAVAASANCATTKGPEASENVLTKEKCVDTGANPHVKATTRMEPTAKTKAEPSLT